MGRKQARETKNLIKNEKIDLIITSSLKRAKETAEIINENFDIEIIEDSRLMERNFGFFEGIAKNERKKLKAINPEINDIWDYNKNISMKNIETMKDFCNRISESLDEIINKYKDKNILIVTHGGVSTVIKCYFLKYPLQYINDREKVKGLKNCEVVEFII